VAKDDHPNADFVFALAVRYMVTGSPEGECSLGRPHIPLQTCCPGANHGRDPQQAPDTTRKYPKAAAQVRAFLGQP